VITPARGARSRPTDTRLVLPRIRDPMAATQIAKPFHRPGWIYEEKVDGWRVLAYKDAVGVRLVSRNAKDLTRRFPALAAAVAALKPPTLLLDSEIAVFDSQLISHFEWIRAQPKGEPATSPTLIAFDCLYTRGKDLRKRPLRVRRNVLEELVDGHTLVLPARRLADDGLEASAQVVERGYEGLVGKDETAPYREGRSLSWLKVKQPRYREGERGWEPNR
jgi:bifunctional non-homologous end joining protein LigD